MRNKLLTIMALLLITTLLFTACEKEAVETPEEEVKSDITETPAEDQETDESDVDENTESTEESTMVEDHGFGWRKVADDRGLRFGAAVEPHQLLEEDFAKTLVSNYNTVTAENRMKWSFIHPEKDVYDFSGSDAIVKFAMDNDMDVRGHALMWHIQNPEWLEEGDFTPEELEVILEDHIKTVVTQYKGQIYAWDVVNEMFENGQYRETLWYKAFGPDYIEKALIWAREADPDVLLYLNDYGVEEVNIKSNAFYDLAKELLDKGVPLDGIGLQFHMQNDNPLDILSVYTNVKRFVDLGLQVDFTEIDVRIRQPITDEKLAKQGDIYREVAGIVVGLDGADNFTTWGITDQYSWVPGFFDGYDAALPFDRSYEPKPAFDQVLALLEDDSFELDYDERIESLADSRTVLKPFDVKKLDSAPNLDGVLSDGEYNQTMIHSFMYNQLGTDATFDESDISGTWRLGYHGNVLYGLVERMDDTTVNQHGTNYENDTVEVFYDYGSIFKQMRSIVGEDFEFQHSERLHKAVWNEEGTIMEFAIEMPEEDLTGITVGFNIALSDNDDRNGFREKQLYPFYGHNNSWQGKDLGNMVFEGNTPRPPEKLRITPAVDVGLRLAPSTMDGEDKGYEWLGGTLLPLGYDQLDALDQTLPQEADLNVSYKMTHFEDKIYGIIYREDNTIEAGDTISLSIELNDEWHTLTTEVGSNAKEAVFEVVWGPDQTTAEYMIDLGEAGFIYNYSVSTVDSDGGVIVHDLHPHCNFGKTPEEGNYIELNLQ